MSSLFLFPALLMMDAAVRFERHDIDDFPAGYQVAVADVNANGKPDVIALSTEADRVDWYENPTWQRRPVARTPRNIDLACCDLDGDGRLEMALASGFYFSESQRGGDIQLLRQGADPDRPWQVHPIAVDPVVHRLRWGDLDGDGRLELVHAPVFGPGSQGARDPKPAHLWAFRVPAKPLAAEWTTWKIDETLTVLHGLYVGDLDGDGRDEILTASFEGIYRFDWEGEGAAAHWRKVHIAPGVQPADAKPGAPRGSSEVVPGSLGANRRFLAAIEPWHGNQVVVYTPAEEAGSWRRRVLDDTLVEGHALVVADFDGDGADEIVAGWRGGDGGLTLYRPAAKKGTGLFCAKHPSGRSGKIDLSPFSREPIDRGIKVEGAVAADLNLDGRLDLIAIAGRSNKLVWYENRGR